jgi:hypothetical protein
MTHSHGKKRRRYVRIGGHLFPQARKAAKGEPVRRTSLCGLISAEAAEASTAECRACMVAKDQLWA